MTKTYEIVIGLEIHARLATATKLFCRCSNDSHGKEPNSLVCGVCMGFPGALPYTNIHAIELALRFALATGAVIHNHSKFDRKNYFYPDLPMGYQISQYDEPISEKGAIPLPHSQGKSIALTRIHIENDAGKLIHKTEVSSIDFNRAGAPLIEIVTEPEIRSSDEAYVFAKEVQALLRSVGSSHADMEKGMMRFDASVSVRELGETELAPRAEIKNLNSFRSLKHAIEFESKRQISLCEQGTPIEKPCTLGWNDDRGETYFMREKENAHDYRYFPEPDLPRINLSDEYIQDLKKSQSKTSLEQRAEYLQYDISPDTMDLFVYEPYLGDFFKELMLLGVDTKSASSWVATHVVGYLREHSISSTIPISPGELLPLIQAQTEGKISLLNAKELLPRLIEEKISVHDLIQGSGLEQLNDENELSAICQKILVDNPLQVAQYKEGKESLIQFFIGQAMKQTKGKANPNILSEIFNRLMQ